MNDTPLQLTMRELRATARSPRMWAVIAIACVLIGAIGPFGTFALPLPMRLGYWSILVISTYALASAVATYCVIRLTHVLPRSPAYALAGAIAGLPVALLVMGINALVFENSAIDPVALLVYCPLIALCISVVSSLVPDARQPASIDAEPAPPREPTILSRLPRPQRGRLMALSVSDHYVDIITDKGHGLVLIRLSDAIAETDGVEGLQIHRSHWVALDAVETVQRRNRRLYVTLRDRRELPVSRSYLGEVRAAGLVP